MSHKLGKDLTKEELAFINEQRKLKSGAKAPIIVEPGNIHYKNTYFLIKDEKEIILSFGIVRDTQIEFQNKQYIVLEFVSVVAAIFGKGYGTTVVNEIKQYAKSYRKTLVGFCTSDLVPFYIKTGFEVMKNGQDRFAFKEDELSFEGETPGQAIFIRGEEDLIEKMENSPTKEAKITRHIF